MLKKLKVHCPDVATNFADDKCMHNMTASRLKEISVGCDALQTDF